MKVLWENNIWDSGVTISSDYETINYPASNLRDKFLHKRFQASGTDDTVRIDLPNTTPIDCLFLGYTNANEYTISFYSSADVLLYSEGITDPEYVEAIYFTEINVDYITIELSCDYEDAFVYLGGVGFGQSYTMPNPLAAWTEDVIDNSNYVSSVAGQSLQNYVDPLAAPGPFNFREVERDTAIEIQNSYAEIGIGGHLWIDPFDENHDFMMPLYAIITEPMRPRKVDRRYRFSLKILEAR